MQPNGMHIRLITPVGPSVLLIDADAERAAETTSMLTGQGYKIAGIAASEAELNTALATGAADVMMIHAPHVSDALLDRLKAIPDGMRRPTVLFSEDGDAETIHAAVAAGINAYVVVGVNGSRMRSAIDLAKANFSNTSGLREELDEARTALRERKIIERAKGLVMKQKGIDEAEAYDLMRKRAMQKAIRLVDIATMITEADELLGG